jgi:DNA-binding transcriptional LysR family regulator
MKDLDFTTLRYFVAVCETGNISRAAALENVVPSAISKRLAVLEGDFGVALFERRRRGVSPTAAGETLLAHARAMLSSATRISQDMASFGTGVRGHVRLLGTVSAIAESLPDDVAAFMARPEYAAIHVHIEEEFSREIVRRVKEGSAALGVLWDAANLDGLRTVPYRADHLGVAVHASHPLAGRKRMAFEAILPYDLVGLTPPSAVNSVLERAASIAEHPLEFRSTVSNFETALRVVRANLGSTVVPLEVAGSYADMYGLKLIPLTNSWARRNYVICFRGREHLSNATARLLEFLCSRRHK